MTSRSELRPLITREEALKLLKAYEPGGPHTADAWFEMVSEMLHGPVSEWRERAEIAEQELAIAMAKPPHDFFIGVTRDTCSGKWEVDVQWEGLRKHLAESFPRTSQFAQHVSQLIYTIQTCQVKPSSR